MSSFAEAGALPAGRAAESAVADWTALVVGGFGALGAAVSADLAAEGADVIRSSRQPRPGAAGAITLDVAAMDALPVLQSVVWAQGVNVNDAADAHTEADLLETFEGNVGLVALQLRSLLAAGRIADGARLVVVSSIWQEVARPGKFSYAVSKAALGGLVRAAALDLAPRGILVNAVLPGVVDTPMTRAMLSPAQIEAVTGSTGHRRMITPDAVATLVSYLASPRNTGVSGQSLVVDLGFSVGHLV